MKTLLAFTWGYCIFYGVILASITHNAVALGILAGVIQYGFVNLQEHK